MMLLITHACKYCIQDRRGSFKRLSFACERANYRVLTEVLSGDLTVIDEKLTGSVES